MDVALVTCAALPGLTADDRLLLDALSALGVRAEPVVWEDPHADWKAPDLCVIRSAWDYAYRRDQFLNWARHAAGCSPLWNGLPVVEWNSHKAYLTDLERAGVPVVPTQVWPAGSSVDLHEVRRITGWDALIVKAAVAQTGRYLMHVSAEALQQGQRHLDRYLPHEDMLVQRYLPLVRRTGEISLVYIDGAFSHAVRKYAAGDDVRVHHDFGGRTESAGPTEREHEVAGAALAAVPHELLYARVDLVEAEPGSPCVMELELVEPELFFRVDPDAARRLAEAIAARGSS